MKNFRDVIELWGRRVALAEAIGEKPVTVSAWWQRDSIPAQRYRAVVRAAHRAGFHEISLELLARLSEERRQRKTHTGEAA